MIGAGVSVQMAKPKLRIIKNKPAPATVGKRLRFDKDTWNAIEVLAQDQMKDIPEVVEEAMRDLLRKHGRSADFRQQLRMSAQETARTEKKTTSQPSGKRKRKRP
jgi:hypothetical protein